MKKLNHIGIFLVCLFITIQSFASEPIRVACIGNSITYGTFIPNREMNCYPAQLQAYLGDGYEVKNFGASGRTILSKGDYPYSETDTYKASLEYQPDIVLIKLGTNDTKPQNWKYKNEFKDNYQTLIDTYQNLKSHPRIILLTPIRCFLPEGSEINAQLIENEVRPTVEELAWKNQLEIINLFNLFGDQWDSVMNYDAFMEPVSWFLTGMEKHSDEFNQGLLGNSESFIGAMTYHMPAFYAPSLYTAMNELDNHDHSRFLTRTNHRVGRVANVGPYAAAENTNKAVLREAVVIQMTWPGAPTLYYGDEAGQVGFTDPDNRRTYPWGQEDQELIRFYKEMIAVHRRFPVLAMGSLKFLYHDYNVLSYGRFNQEEQVIVVINNRNERVHVEIPVWLTGINRSSVAKLTQVFATDAVGFSSEEKEIEAPAGILEMDLLPLSGVVLHRCEE